MSSTKEYLNFIMEQLSDLKDITCKSMMGEFIIYYKGKIIGGIYDNRFLVKRINAAESYMENINYEIPYHGAKKMLLVDNIDDKEYLKGLFNVIFSQLPEYRVKRRKNQ